MLYIAEHNALSLIGSAEAGWRSRCGKRRQAVQIKSADNLDKRITSDYARSLPQSERWPRPRTPTGAALPGAQTSQVVFQCGLAAGSCVSTPVDLGADDDRVYLLLFGVGLRGRSSLAAVTARIGGVDAVVEYAGPQPTYEGLDQINVRLPRSLAGRGEVEIALTADGITANTVTVNIR